MPRRRTLFSLALLATIASSLAFAQPPSFPTPDDIFADPTGLGEPFHTSLAGELLLQSGGQDAETPTFFILRTPDEKKLWGYSTAKGEWKRVSLDDDVQLDDPILSSTAAIVIAGRKAHAFSSLSGEWQSREIAGNEPLFPFLGSTVAVVAGKRQVYAFSSPKGEWQVLDVPGSEQIVPTVGRDYVKIATKDSLSIFSGQRGNWSTVKLQD